MHKSITRNLFNSRDIVKEKNIKCHCLNHIGKETFFPRIWNNARLFISGSSSSGTGREKKWSVTVDAGLSGCMLTC